MAKKVVVNVADVPGEDELVAVQGNILDMPGLSSDMIVYLQRVIRQTIAQVYDQIPNGVQDEPAPKRRGRKLEYIGNLAEGIPSEGNIKSEV